MTLASRIAVMNQGEIVQVGEPDEIYERPSSRFTADFIGSINMFEAEVDPAGANGPTVTCADLGTALKIAPDSGHAAGAAVCLAVRPEKIMIAREAPGNDQVNVVPGKVQGLAYMGNLSIYRVETGSGRVIEVTTANQSRNTDRAVDWDDEVYLSWAPDDAIVLTE